jgi:hypothetical protein
MSLSSRDVKKLCDKEMENDPQITARINEIFRERVKIVSEYCEIVCNKNTISEKDVINILEFMKINRK